MTQSKIFKNERLENKSNNDIGATQRECTAFIDKKNKTYITD